MGPVRIAGDIIGGAGAGFSGAIFASGALTSVTVGGSVTGGDGFLSGLIRSDGALGPVRITGNLEGGWGLNSGDILGEESIASVSIGGSVRGADGDESGRIASNHRIGGVKIGHDLIGARGVSSGSIFSDGPLGWVTIGDSMWGSMGGNTGRITARGTMGGVRITGDLGGGSGWASGAIECGGNLTSLTIGGSLRGGDGSSTGMIEADGAIGPVWIGGDVVGGSATGTLELMRSGEIQGRRIASVTIGGSLIAGTNNTTGEFGLNGAIRAGDDLGPILIKGNILGNDTSPAVISARGSAAPTATMDVAIRRLTVLGRVESAQIVAGIDLEGLAANADAQIGPVVVGGDWIASSIAAGVGPGDDGFFGTDDDVDFADAGVKDVAGLSSRIASVTISGEALGTIGGTDHFSLVAETVGPVKVGGSLLNQTPGPGNDVVEIGTTGDFGIKEI
jgi:hypothetical protein